MSSEQDDGLVDGCDLSGETPLPDDQTDLFVLFAEALDPDTAKTVPEAEAEWRELFG